MTVLLVVLPYGTAIICGALTEWAGKTVSGWCSIGGLALGIYFFFQEYGPFWHCRGANALLTQRDVGLTKGAPREFRSGLFQIR